MRYFRCVIISIPVALGGIAFGQGQDVPRAAVGNGAASANAQIAGQSEPPCEPVLKALRERVAALEEQLNLLTEARKKRDQSHHHNTMSAHDGAKSQPPKRRNAGPDGAGSLATGPAPEGGRQASSDGGLTGVPKDPYAGQLPGSDQRAYHGPGRHGGVAAAAPGDGKPPESVSRPSASQSAGDTALNTDSPVAGSSLDLEGPLPSRRQDTVAVDWQFPKTVSVGERFWIIATVHRGGLPGAESGGSGTLRTLVPVSAFTVTASNSTRLQMGAEVGSQDIVLPTSDGAVVTKLWPYVAVQTGSELVSLNLAPQGHDLGTQKISPVSFTINVSRSWNWIWFLILAVVLGIIVGGISVALATSRSSARSVANTRERPASASHEPADRIERDH
jgi:hypothetical protein